MDNLNSSTKKFPSASEFDKAKDDRFSQAVHQKLKRSHCRCGWSRFKYRRYAS